ncbi:ATP-binding protein [Clostridium sp.]|uniref:ATP-binding protein n=1 Tax=Clostridium sp. TaxID=1506 RepID=UPI003216AA8E
MNIILNKLALKNFKGVKDLSIDFGKVTSISGQNATGKTTIVDAFTWLLFGKDSKDRTTFNIKTLDENGEELHGLEHSVTGVLEVDGQAITLERLYKEKWTKQKGHAQSELKGHTTEYYINEVPSSQKEYQAKVNAIFEESKFKLVTSPLYFTNLKWQEQRTILLEIIGDIDEESVINYNSKLEPLRTLITDGIDNLVKVVKGKISKLKKDVESIPFRVDECNNSIVDVDFDALEFRKRTIQGGINSIDETIADKSKANEQKLELSNKIYEIKREYQEEYNQAKSKINEPKMKLQNQLGDLEYKLQNQEREVRNLERTRGQLEQSITTSENSIANYEKQTAALRESFTNEKVKTLEIDETQFMCPMCKREFEAEDIETKKAELLSNFEGSKKKNLLDIQTRGKGINKFVEEMRATQIQEKEKLEKVGQDLTEAVMKVKEIKEEINQVSIMLSTYTTPEPSFEGMEELKIEIKKLEEEMAAISVDNNLELKAKKESMQRELDQVNRDLGGRENNNKLILRIKELQAEEKGLAIKIAQFEGQQFLCEEFIRTKVELLEEGINKKFQGTVNFKLFNQQINGGLSECCEALIEGVPFSNANTASQMNAGLSVVNTLCEHFDVQAPIFIDNAESVNKIGNTESQLIKLIVSKDKKLKIDVIEIATKDENIYFYEKLKQIQDNIGEYSNGCVVEEFFPEAQFVKENMLDQSRWSICKEQIYKYKNLYLRVVWDDPATEMQEGQETNCKVMEVEE